MSGDFELDGRPEGFNLASERFSPPVRVSTAAVPGCHSYGYYLQYETWIFSEDPRFRSRQWIWGTSPIPSEGKLKKRALRGHRLITRIVSKRIAEKEGGK